MPNPSKKQGINTARLSESGMSTIETKSGGFRVVNYSDTKRKKENLRSIEYKKRLGSSPFTSQAFGQWFFFTGDFAYLYKSGFYKDGLKDSVWVSVFDDYPIPKLCLFKDGIPTNYAGEVKILDNNGLVWIHGQDLTLNELPKGTWELYRYDFPKPFKFQYNFERRGDSILVHQREIDIHSKDILKEWEYFVEYDSISLFNYSSF